MSGPKGGSYSVVDNAAIERRALEQSRARASELARQLEALHREAAAFNEDHPDHAVSLTDVRHPGESSPRAALDRYVADARSAKANTRGRLEAARVNVRVASAVGTLGTGDGRRAASARISATPTPAAPVPSATVESSDEPVQVLVDRVLARLDGEAPAAERAAVEEIAARLLSRDAGGAGAGPRLELRLRVDAANEAAAAWRSAEARLHRLLDGLGDLTGSDVDAMITRLGALLAAREPLPVALEEQAEQVLAGARAEADRRYAAQVLAGELEAMGYEVGPTFAVQLASNQTALAARPGWGPYAVRIRFDEPDGVNLHVVRDDDRPASSAENQRIRDREVETAWCGDLGVIEQRMGERGVELDLSRRTAPGVKPVLSVPGVASATEAHHVAKAKERNA